jgi:hypothetical protein
VVAGSNDCREAYPGKDASRKRETHPAQAIQPRKCQSAGGEAVMMAEPNTAATAQGEVGVGLPGSQSVARVQGSIWNEGGPESACCTNYEGQAGTAAQRQEAPSRAPGVGSVHSISRQGASPDAKEGADSLAKFTQATSTVRMTEPTGKPSCERRRRVRLKSPVRENRPPGSVRGAPGNRRPYRHSRQNHPEKLSKK